MQAKLIVIGGKANKKELSLNLPVIVGRSRGVGLTIAHPMVSRQHCEIFEADGAVRIRDLGSTNGTFVAGRKVPEAVLRPHDQFSIGPLTFEVDYEYLGDATVVEQYEDFTSDARATALSPKGSEPADGVPEEGLAPVSEGESAEDAAFNFFVSSPDAHVEPVPPPGVPAEPVAAADSELSSPAGQFAAAEEQGPAEEWPVDAVPEPAQPFPPFEPEPDAMLDFPAEPGTPMEPVEPALGPSAVEPGEAQQGEAAAPEPSAIGPAPREPGPSIAPPDGEVPDFSDWSTASGGDAAAGPSMPIAPPISGVSEEFGPVLEYPAPEAGRPGEEVGVNPEPGLAWDATPDSSGSAVSEEPTVGARPSPWENPVDDEDTATYRPSPASSKPKARRSWWPFGKGKGEAKPKAKPAPSAAPPDFESVGGAGAPAAEASPDRQEEVGEPSPPPPPKKPAPKSPSPRNQPQADLDDFLNGLG